MSRTIRGGTGAFPQHEIDRREKNARLDAERAAREEEPDFRTMTVAELRVYAQEYDIVGYSNLRKAELLVAVEKAHG